jgi:hypothetical protein
MIVYKRESFIEFDPSPFFHFSNSRWTFEDSQGTLTTRMVEEMDPFFCPEPPAHTHTHTLTVRCGQGDQMSLSPKIAQNVAQPIFEIKIGT